MLEPAVHRRFLLAPCLLLCLALGPAPGCVVRTALYAPRLTDTPAHRDARAAKTCAACHEPAKIRLHAPADDCVSCHHLCTGC